MFGSVEGKCWGGWQGFQKGRGSSKRSLRLGILPGGDGDEGGCGDRLWAGSGSLTSYRGGV